MGEQASERERKLLEALIESLIDVIDQACHRSDGRVCHDFISAYESALTLLARLGYATTEDDVYYTLRWPQEVAN